MSVSLLRQVHQRVASGGNLLLSLSQLRLQLVDGSSVENCQRCDSLSNGRHLGIILCQTVEGVLDEDDAESNVGSSVVGERANELLGVLRGDVELLDERGSYDLSEVVDAAVLVHGVIQSLCGLVDAFAFLHSLE